MKKYVFGIFAVLLAVGFSSFSADHRKPGHKTFDEQIWYDFAGGDENNLSLYSPDPDDMSDCPAGGTVLCEVLAFPIASGPDAGKPDFSRSNTKVRYTP